MRALKSISFVVQPYKREVTKRLSNFELKNPESNNTKDSKKLTIADTYAEPSSSCDNCQQQESPRYQHLRETRRAQLPTHTLQGIKDKTGNVTQVRYKLLLMP